MLDKRKGITNLIRGFLLVSLLCMFSGCTASDKVTESEKDISVSQL